jgi:trk system potassium uptake protein TrkA
VPILGEGPIQQELLRASIQDSDVLIALADDDSWNALVAQMAKHIYQVPKVICRIDDPKMHQMYDQLGITATSGTILVTGNIVEEANA